MLFNKCERIYIINFLINFETYRSDDVNNEYNNRMHSILINYCVMCNYYELCEKKFDSYYLVIKTFLKVNIPFIVIINYIRFSQNYT